MTEAASIWSTMKMSHQDIASLMGGIMIQTKDKVELYILGK